MIWPEYVRRSFSVKISNPMSGGVISSKLSGTLKKAHASSNEMGKTMEVRNSCMAGKHAEGS